MWPDPRVSKFVQDNFIPARVHVKDDAQKFVEYGDKYGAQWTPTVLQLDPKGEERARIEGFLPTDDFLAQLMLGRAHLAFGMGQWDDAERRFREVVEKFPNSDAAPEALYWAGVAPYKKTHDPASLGATAKAFKERYQGTPWAKKASIWG